MQPPQVQNYGRRGEKKDALGSRGEKNKEGENGTLASLARPDPFDSGHRRTNRRRRRKLHFLPRSSKSTQHSCAYYEDSFIARCSGAI